MSLDNTIRLVKFDPDHPPAASQRCIVTWGEASARRGLPETYRWESACGRFIRHDGFVVYPGRESFDVYWAPLPEIQLLEKAG